MKNRLIKILAYGIGVTLLKQIYDGYQLSKLSTADYPFAKKPTYLRGNSISKNALELGVLEESNVCKPKPDFYLHGSKELKTNSLMTSFVNEHFSVTNSSVSFIPEINEIILYNANLNLQKHLIASSGSTKVKQGFCEEFSQLFVALIQEYQHKKGRVLFSSFIESLALNENSELLTSFADLLLKRSKSESPGLITDQRVKDIIPLNKDNFQALLSSIAIGENAYIYPTNYHTIALSRIGQDQFIIFDNQFKGLQYYNNTEYVKFFTEKYNTESSDSKAAIAYLNPYREKYQHNGATLFYAARGNYISLVEKAMKSDDIDVNLQQKDGYNALMIAAQNGHADVVEKLMERKDLEVNSQMKDGFNALMIAAQNGHADIVEKLIERKDLEVNLQEKDGYNALMMAATKGHTYVVEKLMEREDLEVNCQGSNALMMAAEKGHADVVEKLMERKDLEVNLQKKDGYNALMMAAQNGHADVVEKLMKRKDLEVNLQEKDGFNALMMAATKGHTYVVEKLMEREDLEVNLQEKGGFTALLYAIYNGHIKTAEALMEHGADLEPKSVEHTALSSATSSKNNEMIALVKLEIQKRAQPKPEQNSLKTFSQWVERIEAINATAIPAR